MAGAQVVGLIRQREYIDELEAGVYRHVRQERIIEWLVEFLTRPRRYERAVPDLLADDPP